MSFILKSKTSAAPGSPALVTVVLRDPERGDNAIRTPRLVVVHLLDGSIRTYIRQPLTERRTYNFTKIPISTIQLLDSLIFDTASNPKEIVTHTGEVTNCLILTEKLELVNDGADECGDTYSFQLDFEVPL